MDGTIIQQGSFISTGADVTIQLRSGVDWMKVYNYTTSGVPAQFSGTEFYWQRGFAANDAILQFFAAGGGSQVISTTTAAVGVGAGAVGGFTLVDSSLQTVGPATAFTAISTANPPRVTVASTALLRTGDVVRLTNILGAPQFGGYDFGITVIDGTHFDLTGAPQLAVAGTAGFYRKIFYPSLYYPRRRSITKITQAVNAQVTTAVMHGYTVGQELRMIVPPEFGMVELDQMAVTVMTIVDEYNFTINVDTTAFTAFAFPLAAAVPFTPAEAVPMGEDTGQALIAGVDILGDATINLGYIGMLLAGGAASPGGANGNVMYWVAGKSFNV